MFFSNINSPSILRLKKLVGDIQLREKFSIARGQLDHLTIRFSIDLEDRSGKKPFAWLRDWIANEFWIKIQRVQGNLESSESNRWFTKLIVGLMQKSTRPRTNYII